MLNSVNKVIIIGTISAEPSIKYTENGFFVATMSVVTRSAKKTKIEDRNDYRNDYKNDYRNDYKVEYKTEYKNEWHRILLYNKFEGMINFLKKEKIIYLEGSLRTNKWQDKDNNYRYMTEIIASDIKILDTKNGDIEFDIEEDMNKNNRTVFDENIPF